MSSASVRFFALSLLLTPHSSITLLGYGHRDLVRTLPDLLVRIFLNWFMDSLPIGPHGPILAQGYGDSGEI
jgi:hypothetical protein